MKSLKRVWSDNYAPAVREISIVTAENRKERLRDYTSFPDSQPSVPPLRST